MSSTNPNNSSSSQFDLIFTSPPPSTSSSIPESLSANSIRDLSLHYQENPYYHHQQHHSSHQPDPETFHIIRNVLSMLNGLNVETVKKNPNDIFMLLKRSSDSGGFFRSPSATRLDDETCQLIIRIGGLGKILLKIINYLNYYKMESSGKKGASAPSKQHQNGHGKPDRNPSYPMFDSEDGGGKNTLGNIKQYYVSAIHDEIKAYHYDLLMIESRFRLPGQADLPYRCALRRILIWTNDWLDKFLFLSESLKCCLDLRGVALLNAVFDQSQTGSPLIRRLSRGIHHQALKPFIFNMFDWLLSGEVQTEIGSDFFISIRDKTEMADGSYRLESASNAQEKDDETGGGGDDVDFEWKIYELNVGQLPTFMSRLQIKKIYFIGNAVRLLRYMLKDEYDARAVMDMFSQLNSPIAASYDTMRKFVYKSAVIDSYGSSGNLPLSGAMSELAITEITHTEAQQQQQQDVNEELRFFFEHPLVDELDLLLDSYYEVINDEMFKLLNMSELKSQFETQLGFVLMQRGDFYESLIDYLLPLLRKPASEVVNIVAGSCTNLHRIFHMFMVNAKLIELSQVYKIDSLLYNNYDISDSLIFTFSKYPPPLKHHLGWDIFLARYRFTKKVYNILFDGSSGVRYERLFRQLLHFKRVLYSIRKCQERIRFYIHQCNRPSKQASRRLKLFTPMFQMIRTLHFLLFHQFGFASRMYQHFGSQIASSWAGTFAVEFSRKQKNIELFVRAHGRFLAEIEAIVFFGRDPELQTAFAAVNGAILDFCEEFTECELFPTLDKILVCQSQDVPETTTTPRKQQQQQQPKEPEEMDFEELQACADALFRHQFKVSIAISKYRCCISNFITLAQAAGTSTGSDGLEFKYDILNYQPCLDQLFACHSVHHGRRMDGGPSHDH